MTDPGSDQSAAAVRAAPDRIAPVFLGTPQYVHDGLSAMAGRPIIVKIEALNPIGSFKGRGTWLAVRGLIEEGRIGPDRPIVVASTGNFGQGIAYAGRHFGIPVVVFADERANPRKLGRIRQFGATVIQAGEDFDAAREASEAHAQQTGAWLLIDGEDARIGAGAGTLALELTEAAERGDLPPLATAHIPVGNGSLICGVGTWLRAAAPGCRVIGVQSDAAPSMTLSWRAGQPIETETAATYAEGIATRVPVPTALDWMASCVDDMALVSEDDLRAAQAELSEALGLTVEGAGAASWAAIRRESQTSGLPDGAALVLVTGNNVARGG